MYYDVRRGVVKVDGQEDMRDFTSPKVYVEARQTVRDVILQLGSRAATIHGTVTDATDRKSVSKVTIALRRADNPNILYQIGAAEPKRNGIFKVLVPPLPFTIEVSSREYETWTYGENGSNGHSDALTVNRGQTKSLNIMLRRRKNPND
jgi:Carboxypeptidase regulatory-like domain